MEKAEDLAMGSPEACLPGIDLDTSIEPALRIILLPKDTNGTGTIFGGAILSYIDLAGAVEARRHCNAIFVTVSMREVVFRHPVYVGDVVSFYTKTKKIGTTSITVSVRVEAIRVIGEQAGERVHVTEGEVVYVAMDQEGNKLRIGG
ncbi:acyl-CoA thioesterase [Candidatus Zixiibacteriota bacterium]